jgi:leucyl-tRNA synthetase
MMEFVNFFNKQTVRPRSAMERFVLLLSPYAPHIAEELWQVLGHGETLAYEPWPQYDEALTRENTIEVPVQVLGKLRAKVCVPRGRQPGRHRSRSTSRPESARVDRRKTSRQSDRRARPLDQFRGERQVTAAKIVYVPTYTARG